MRKEAFEEQGMVWPVDHDCPEVNTSGMVDREIEVALFMHKVFAPLRAKMSLSSATATSPCNASLPTRLMREAMSDKALGS